MATDGLKNRARTKIVATVGPACREPAQLQALVEAGVDVFRLNMAHASIEEHTATLAEIRKLSERLGTPIGVLIDLAGPKIRLGELDGGQCEVAIGEEIEFVRGETAQCPKQLVSTYDRLIDELQTGDRVMLADGTVTLRVVSRKEDSARCVVLQGGLLRSRQGINLPGVKVSLPAMSEVDHEHARWAAASGIDFVSLSFVRTPTEVRRLKNLLRSANSHARVIAKIEKQEALDSLEEIVAASDGVMVARGDLGVEIDVARMPVVQKEIVACCHRWQKPVIIATQMLDSMQHSRRPTRAETTDVANAILDGCDACMLSGETAVGKYPREAVEMMNSIAMATEPLFQNRHQVSPPDVLPEDLKRITQAVVFGAGKIANELPARLIVVASHSGATALAVAKQRNYMPTVGVSDRPETLRQMCLYWGVIPLGGTPSSGADDLLKFIERWGRAEHLLEPGDNIVLVAGVGLSSHGHNMIMVHPVG